MMKIDLCRWKMTCRCGDVAMLLFVRVCTGGRPELWMGMEL